MNPVYPCEIDLVKDIKKGPQDLDATYNLPLTTDDQGSHYE